MKDQKHVQSGKFTLARRGFLKTSAFGIFATWIGAQIVSTPRAEAQAGEMVKESDPTAKALGYHEDAKKVDTKKWEKRKGAEGAKQLCWNCQFYQTKDKASATKSAPCTIFAGKQVAAQGWCNSWTLNPNAK